MTERVLGYLYERLDRTHGLDRQRVWFDMLYVQRYNPSLRPYFEWAGFGTAYAEAANAGEHAAIVEMVERHEGRASAAIARYWLTRQPEAFHAIRRVGGGLIGFVANLQPADGHARGHRRRSGGRAGAPLRGTARAAAAG